MASANEVEGDDPAHQAAGAYLDRHCGRDHHAALGARVKGVRC